MFHVLALLLVLAPQLVDRTEELSTPPPTQEVSLEERADIMMARKMYREAIDLYQQALDAEPDNSTLHNKLGIAYHHLGFLDRALESYEQAAGGETRGGGFGGFFKKLFGAGDPTPVKPGTLDDSTYAKAVNNMGTVYYAQRKYGKSAKFYQKALEHTPKSASLHSNLGTAYFAQKKYEQASEEFLIALQLDPNVFENRSRFGTLLQERSVEDRAKYYYHMAESYAKAGMYEHALLYLRHALENGFEDRKRILREAAFEPLHENETFQRLLKEPEERAALTR